MQCSRNLALVEDLEYYAARCQTQASLPYRTPRRSSLHPHSQPVWYLLVNLRLLAGY